MFKNVPSHGYTFVSKFTRSKFDIKVYSKFQDMKVVRNDL